jgi:hypothetical protein
MTDLVRMSTTTKAATPAASTSPMLKLKDLTSIGDIDAFAESTLATPAVDSPFFL